MRVCAKQVKLGYLVTGAVALGLLLVFVFQGYYPGGMNDFVNLATPVVAGAAALTAFLTGRRYGLRSKEGFGKAWQYFVVGIATWFVAEVVYSYYVLALNVPLPYPSAADAFYLAGYLFFFLGYVHYMKVFSGSVRRANLIVGLAVVAVAAVVVGAYSVAPLVASSGSALAKALDVVYPGLDLALFAAVVIGFGVLRSGTLGKAWLLLNLAVVIDVAADVAYSYSAANGSFAYGSASDLMYLWGYLLLALAFYVHGSEL